MIGLYMAISSSYNMVQYYMILNTTQQLLR